MSEHLHSRAQQLFAQSLIEGLPQADQSWLEEHLRVCADCARYAGSTQELLRALRSVPIVVPRDLAARTQLRVRLWAQQTAESSAGSLVLWSLTAVSWLLGVFSAPLVWRGFAWLGAHFGLPKSLLEVGFLLWWVVPALIAAFAVLHHKSAGSSAKSI